MSENSYEMPILTNSSIFGHIPMFGTCMVLGVFILIGKNSTFCFSLLLNKK